MALIADDAAHRVEQLLLMSERLAALAAEDTRRIEAREPLREAENDERNRLANAYRLELARIKQDHALIQEAPPRLLERLRASTVVLHKTLDAHELALNAVKLVSEGLVHAMAEEVVRQRGSGASYSAQGALDPRSGPSPTVLDRSA